MAKYEVNQAGVDHARSLIERGKVDSETEWSDAQPTTDQENDFIDEHGYEEFGKWHLAVEADASPDTKGRYGFPFGDFTRLSRDGLTSAKQRAAQYEHHAIERAADDLLSGLDS